MIARDGRFFKETAPSFDLRTPAQIDRDRILYSPHFLRLAEVTQVRSTSGDFLVHNRLTHSLKVAQVAQRMAQGLQKQQKALASTLGLDADVAEAAGLAHDLGHPPFGHIAEEKLDELVSEASEGYEGNAQSFRIVTALSVSDAAPTDGTEDDFVAGLNLTSATLNAILKYPWGFRGNPDKLNKWGSYTTEKEVFDWARRGFSPKARSVEAEIMDWADDITYAIHDMIDFYSAGLIPLHLLANQKKGGDLARREWEEFFGSTCGQKENQKIALKRKTYEDALQSAFGLAGIEGPFTGSQEQSSTIWRFSSDLISRYIGALKLVDPTKSSDGASVEIGQAERDQTTILKQLTWHYVIRRSDLATAQHGQRRMIESLFMVFKKAIEDEQWELFPVGFSQLIRANQKIGASRWAADYISGLTERQVCELHGKLSGL